MFRAIIRILIPTLLNLSRNRNQDQSDYEGKRIVMIRTKGDIIVETSEDTNTSSPAQSTVTSNTSEDPTLCGITPNTPQKSLTSLDISEDFVTSRESTPCPTVHSATSTLIVTPNKPIITKSTHDEYLDATKDIRNQDHLLRETITKQIEKDLFYESHVKIEDLEKVRK